MMRASKKPMIVLSLITLWLAGCATQKGESVVSPNFHPEKLSRVAFVDVTGQIHGEPAKNRISDFFTAEFMRKGYAVISRAKVLETLEAEKQLQASNVTTETQAAKTGKILNVPAVIFVNVPTYGEEIDMTAKLIDVESGEVLWLGSGFAETGKKGATFLGAAVGAAAGAVLAGGDSGDRAIGGIVGGVLGGAAGNALSPEESEILQKLIKEKVCAGLPARN